MVKHSILALLLLGSASAVAAAADGQGEAADTQQAAPAAAPPAQTQQAEDPDKDKTICRTEKVTGYRAKYNRICMTKAEWEVYTVREQEELEKMREQTTPGTRGGGGAGR